MKLRSFSFNVTGTFANIVSIIIEFEEFVKSFFL
jgi:hypothetical protein